MFGLWVWTSRTDIELLTLTMSVEHPQVYGFLPELLNTYLSVPRSVVGTGEFHKLEGKKKFQILVKI